MMNGPRVSMGIAGFDDTCNRALNYAVKVSGDFKCENVNTAHLFVGLVAVSPFGDMLSEYKGHTNNATMIGHLMASLEMLVDNGDFGYSDGNIFESIKNGRLSFFSNSVGQIIAKITTNAFTGGEEATYDKLLTEILDEQEIYLMKLLSMEDVEIEEIKEMLRKKCIIPSELEAYVQDMTTNRRILNSTFVNTEKYTDEIVEILGRKKKPNPLLVGKAGVGKTAVVEAFAQRVAHGDVPNFLKDLHICSVDGSMLTAGTRYRGDFEARMQTLISFAENNDVILFIDEIHSFVHAGSGVQGAETAGNMIKTKMNDGSIKVIGATTHKEYKKFVENDDALCRRMENIEIKEPSLEDAIDIVCDSIVDYEEHHSVNIPDSSVELAAMLSNKYMKSKSFPDKVYTIIDHASSYAKVHDIKEVTSDIIEKTVSKLTGISLDKLTDTNIKRLLKLEETLGNNVIGQPEAIKTVSKAIRRGKAGISDSNKPLASFLFVGPTGVGKTELCKILSKEVAFGDMPLIKVDMSEFADKISVNKMIGSAPGYVGYGEGGQLTEKIKHNPHSLILFDEIEKAHTDVFDIFLQILDEGRLTDSEGDLVDFTNCIIVMTSNAFVSNAKSIGFSSESKTEDEKRRDKEQRVLRDLENTFKPELLNRIDNIVLFNSLSEEQCENITKLLLNKLSDRVFSEKQITLTFSNELVTYVTHRGYNEKYGARNIRREIQNTVEDALATAILTGDATSGDKVEAILDKDNNILIK